MRIRDRISCGCVCNIVLQEYDEAWVISMWMVMGQVVGPWLGIGLSVSECAQGGQVNI